MDLRSSLFGRATGRLLQAVPGLAAILPGNNSDGSMAAATSNLSINLSEFSIDCFISFFSYVSLQGWAYDPQARVTQVCIRQDGQRYGQAVVDLPSPSVSLGRNLQFELSTQVPGLDWSKAVIELTFNNGAKFDLTMEAVEARRKELCKASGRRYPPDDAFDVFMEQLADMQGATLVDVGGRARSGTIHRELFPTMNYIGADILAGENVDIVCDAHELATTFAHGSVDAIFSASTFEHLAMPWKVAIELNRIMRMGGVGYIRTHQTVGMHDLPWDFWRFSDMAWRSLFNRHTGFEILSTHLGERMFIVPFDMEPKWLGSEAAVGFGLSSVTFRKTSETQLRWDVPADDLTDQAYPA